MDHLRRPVLIASLIALTLLPARASDFHRSTSAGHPVRISSHSTLDGNCDGSAAKVDVTSPPAHGSVFTRLETTTVSRIEVGSAKCMGSHTAATAVYYKPQPGFHGTDGFAYTSTTQSGALIDHAATIDVR